MTLSSSSAPPPGAPAPFRAQKGLLIALGVLTLIGGFAAIVWPVFASLAVTTLVGAALMAQGFVQFWDALTAAGWRPRFWHLLTGLIALLGGAMLLLKPFAGVVALTTLLIATILASGLTRVFMAFRARPQKGWGWLLLSGLISLGCGGYLANLYVAGPESFAQEDSIATATRLLGFFGLLGLMAGVSLIFEGWSYLILASALPKRREAEEGEEDWADPAYEAGPATVQPPAAPAVPGAPRIQTGAAQTPGPNPGANPPANPASGASAAAAQRLAALPESDDDEEAFVEDEEALDSPAAMRRPSSFSAEPLPPPKPFSAPPNRPARAPGVVAAASPAAPPPAASPAPAAEAPVQAARAPEAPADLDPAATPAVKPSAAERRAAKARAAAAAAAAAAAPPAETPSAQN